MPLLLFLLQGTLHPQGILSLTMARELAVQIHNVLNSLLAFHPSSAAFLQQPDPEQDDEVSETHISSAKDVSAVLSAVIRAQLLVGGSTPPAEDLSKFLQNSPNVLVATPGRLLELLSSPHVHCPQSSFEVLVLDEADRLLDLGFKDTITKILSRLPKQRRTGLFSASVSEAVDEIVRVGLRNPVRIAVKVKGAGREDQKTPARLAFRHFRFTANRSVFE